MPKFVADSAETTGLKWAAASSGLTLIKTATFSNVADTGTTFDGVFSSTYRNYEILYACYGATDTADFHFQLRYAGPTTQTATYFWQMDSIEGATPTSTWSRNSSDSEWELGLYLGSSPYALRGRINILDLNPSDRPGFIHHGFNPLYEYGTFGQGYQATARTYTGFLLKASTGNIYGTVSVYGLAK